jgi:hypothetical protein
MYFGFEVSRKVPEYFVALSMSFSVFKVNAKVFQITFEVSIKTGSYWRQLIRVPDIDVCSVFSSESSYTMVKEFITFVLKKVYWIPTKCPLIPGKFYGNQTILDNPDPKTASREEIVKFQQVANFNSCWKSIRKILNTLAEL